MRITSTCAVWWILLIITRAIASTTNGPPASIQPLTSFDDGQEENATNIYVHDDENPLNQTVAPSPDLVQVTPDMVDDTLRLLRQGDEVIELRPEYRDIVLLVGNTGAGKTTIGKFLTGDNHDLISYDAGDRYLIRDTEGKISVNSTVLSKSIFPDLMLDTTNSIQKIAFYDLPGFSDTRNSSVEIANSFFIRKVASHARNLKIIFIVNHSTLRSGESRTAFKNLIEHATTFLKNSKKFTDGIALIASKVESVQSDLRIVKGIANFLKGIQNDLPNFIQNDTRRQNADHLLEAFLTQDFDPFNSDTEYFTRIGLFRQPDEEGPLSNISRVQRGKFALQRVVRVNTEFVPSSGASDFGLSVSDTARLLVVKLIERTNTDVASAMKDVGGQMKSFWLNRVITETSSSSSPQFSKATVNLLGQLERDYWILKNLTKINNKIQPKSDNRLNFLSILVQNLRSTVWASKLNDTKWLSAILKRNEDLQIFEQIIDDDTPLPIRHLEWTHPFGETASVLSSLIFDIGQKLDSHLLLTCIRLRDEFQQEFQQKIDHTHTTSSSSAGWRWGEEERKKLKSMLSRNDDLLSQLVMDLGRAHYLHEVVNEIGVVLRTLSVFNPQVRGQTELLERLENLSLRRLWGFRINLRGLDPSDGLASPYQVHTWMRPFEQLSNFLRREVNGIVQQERMEDRQKERADEAERYWQNVMNTERERRERERCKFFKLFFICI